MTTFWTRPNGTIIKATADGDPPPNGNATAVQVPPNPAPESGKQKWLGKEWSDPPIRRVPTSELEDAILAAGSFDELKLTLSNKIAAR